MLSPLDTDYADDNVSLRQQQLEQQYAREQVERENYENSLNESNQKAMSTYEYAKVYGVANRYLDHFVETQLSTQQKFEEVQKNALGKTITLEGGIEGELIRMPDADTGEVRLPDGTVITVRLHTGSSTLKYDAIDERETLTGENGYAKSQRSTALQIGLLSDLTGKSPFLDSLSKADFDNYHNWSTIERQKSLNEKDPVFEPYDPNKKYEQLAPEALSKKKVYLKVYGQDKYGRYTAEMINPDTGRSIGFDSALNPYENTRFKLLDSIDTPRNRERIRRFEAQQKSYADMLFEEAAKHDSDGRLAEDGDLIQSAAYQMAARVLQHIPGLDEPYWHRIASDQRWADLAAGVSKHTRDDFQKKAQQISDLIEQGKYEEATILAFTQVDRFLAESTPQMALLMAGSYIAGGALGMAGITAQSAATAGAVSTVAYKLTKAFAGATLAGIDKTLTDIEDYKKNNDGQSMSMDEYAKTFLLATISLVPEEFVLGMVGNGAKTAFGGAISRLLGRPVTKAAVEPTAKILGRAAGRLGFGAATEYGQERLETAIDTAASARRDAKYEGILKETLKAFDTPENRQAGLVGGVMGFTLGGATNVISTPFEFRKNDQIQNYVNNVQHNFRNQTAEEFDPNINEKRTSSNIDTKASDDILKRVTEHSIPVQESSSKQIVTEIRNLEKLSANSVNLRADSATALQNRLTELYKELATRVQNSEEVKQAKTPEERTKAIAKLFAQQANTTPETAFRKIVYGARPELIGGVDPIKGTRLSKDDIEAKKEELTELGKNLGLSEDFVARTLEEVNDDIRYGYNGFQTAIDNINIIRAEASNKKNKKKDFTPQLTRNIKQIVRLLAYQSTKLRQFAETAKSISDENKSSTQMITFPSGQQFELNGEVLAALGLSEDKGPNRVVNSIVRDIAEMKEAINGLNKKEKAILEKAISDFNRFNEYHINYDLTEQTDESLKQYKDAIAIIQTKSAERFRKNLETSTNNSDNIDIYPIVNNLSRLADAAIGKINLKDKDKLARINSIRALNENQIQRLKDHLKDAKYNDEKKARMIKALDDILSSKAESDAIAKTFDDANKEYREKARTLVESFTPKAIKSLTINDDEIVKARLAEFKEVLDNFKNITDEDSRIYGKLQSNWTLFKRKLESLGRAKQEQARREQAKKEAEEKTKKSEESKQESKQESKSESKSDSKQESKQDSKPASKKPSFKDTATKLLNKIANIRNNLKNLNTEGLQKLHDEVRNEFIHLSEQFPDMNMNNLRTTVSNFLTDVRARLGKQPNPSTPTSETKSNTTQESQQTPSETKSEAKSETKSEPKADAKPAPKFAKTLEDGRNRVKVVMGGIRKSLNSNNMTVQGLTAVRNNIYDTYLGFITSFPEGNVDPLRTSVNNLIHDIDVRIRNKQATPASTKSKVKTKPSLTVAQGKKNIHIKLIGMRNSLKKNTNVEGLRKLQNEIQQEYAKLVAMFPNVNMGETHTSVVNLVNDIQRKINKLTNTVEKAPEIPSKATPAFEQGKIPETKEKPVETKSEPKQEVEVGQKTKALGTKESPIQVYSDGSDIKGTGKLGYGAVFIVNGKEYAISGTNEDDVSKELSNRFPNMKFSNPTMEILALAQALKTIANLGVGEHIQINQDYTGASNYAGLWEHAIDSSGKAKKAWKAKEPYIKFLVDEAVAAIKQIEANGGSVSIQWVKGHQKAGTEQARMNDLADKYAKSREHINTFADAYTTQNGSKIDSKATSEKTGTSTKEESKKPVETKSEQKSFAKSPIDGTRPEYKTEVGDVFASTDKDGTIRFFTYKNGKLRCGNIAQFFAYIKGTSKTTNKTTKAVSEQKKVVFDNIAKLGYTEKFLKSILTTPEIIRDFILFHEKSHLRHEDARVYVTNDLMHTTNIDIETRATLEGLQELGQVYPEIAKKLEQIKKSEEQKSSQETKSTQEENINNTQTSNRVIDNRPLLPFLSDKTVSKLNATHLRESVKKRLMEVQTEEGCAFYIASKAAEVGFTLRDDKKLFIKEYGKQLGISTELLDNLDLLDSSKTTPSMESFVDDGKYALGENGHAVISDTLSSIYIDDRESTITKLEIDLATELVRGLQQGKAPDEIFTEYANNVLNKEVKKELQKQSKATSTPNTEASNSKTSKKVETTNTPSAALQVSVKRQLMKVRTEEGYAFYIASRAADLGFTLSEKTKRFIKKYGKQLNLPTELLGNLNLLESSKTTPTLEDFTDDGKYGPYEYYGEDESTGYLEGDMLQSFYEGNSKPTSDAPFLRIISDKNANKDELEDMVITKLEIDLVTELVKGLLQGKTTKEIFTEYADRLLAKAVEEKLQNQSKSTTTTTTTTTTTPNTQNNTENESKSTPDNKNENTENEDNGTDSTTEETEETNVNEEEEEEYNDEGYEEEYEEGSEEGYDESNEEYNDEDYNWEYNDDEEYNGEYEEDETFEYDDDVIDNFTQEEETNPNMSLLEKAIASITKGIKNLGISISAYEKLMFYRLQLRDAINDYKQNHEVVKAILDKGEELIGRITKQELKTAAEYNRSRANRIDGILPIIYTNTSEATNETVLTNKDGLLVYYMNPDGSAKLSNYNEFIKYLEKDSKDILDVLKFMDVHSSKSIGRDFKEYNKLQEEFKKTKDTALLEEYGKARDERINIGETTFYGPATLQSVIDIAVREDMTNADKKALQREVQDNIRTFLLLYEKAKMRYNINGKSTLEQRTQAFTSAVEEYTSFAKHNFYVEDTVSKNSLISKLLDAERNSMVTFSPSKKIDNFDLNNEVVIRSPECVLATSPTNLYSQKRLSQAVTKIATQMNLGTILKKHGKDFPLAFLTKHSEEIGSSPLQQAPHYQFLYQIFKNDDGTVAFNANQFVFEIVDFSVKEYVATMGLSDKLTKSMPKSAVARMFGLNDETLSYSDIGKLRNIVKEKGIPKGAIANALGSLILRNLGIRPNKNTGTREFYSRLITGFGLFGLQYLSTAGIIKNNAIPHKVLENTGIPEFSKSAQEFDAVDSISNGELVDTGSESESSGVDIPTIQIVKEGKSTLEAFKTQFKTQLKEWKHQTSYSNEPRWSPTKIKDTNYVRHTEDLIEVPDVVQSTMDKLSNNAYEFDNELTEVVLKNKDKLKQRLGYVETDISKNPEFAHLSYDEQESIKGRNLDIENEIESMENAFNEQRNRQIKGEFEGIYFNWFMSKNGRLFIDSNTLNPQVNKTQRFLCMPKLSKASFDVNNSEHLEAEAFAIAQAFDVLDGDTTAIADKMRSLTVEQLQAVQQALFELDGKAFEAWTDKHLGMELGIENLGQCLNVLQHLIRRKQSDGKVFDTWLAIENDSTTSGYAIRFFNIPFEDVMEEFGPKTGILDNKTLEMFKATSMHGLKQSSNFLDIYKTIAKDAVTHLPTEEMAQNAQEMQELYKKYFKKNMNLTLTDKALAQFAHLYETLFNALPGLENGKVSKSLRTLMKPGVMTFGYTAGDRSIIRKLASELTSGDGGFIALYTRYKYAASLNKNLTYEQFAQKIGKSADHIKAVMETMGIIETLIDTKDGTLLHQLKTKTIGEIVINLQIEKQTDTGKTYQTTRQVTLDQYFNHILYPTVGEAVTSSLDKSFAAYKQINDYMNYMTVNMFNLFDSVYKAVLDDAQSKGPLTTAQYKKLIDSLKDIFPAIDLGYGKNIDRNDGRILLTSFKKSYSSKIKATNWETETTTVKGSDGKPVTKEIGRQRTAHADMRTFANPRKSGAVIPVHAVDGMVLLLTMLDSIEGNGNVSFTPVHDAIVMSALQGLTSTRSYNGSMYLVNKEYNIFNEIFSRFKSIADAYENKYRKQFPNLPALETIVAKTSFGRPIDEDATVNTSYNEALVKGYITKAEYDKAITSIMHKDKKIKNKKEAGETKADFETLFTIPLLLEKAQVHNDKIQQARDAFYDSSNVIHVMNMDGQAGTNVEINSMTPDSITEATIASKVHQAIGKKYQKKYGATSNGFVTSGQTAKLLQDAKTDKKARIQLLHALNGVEYAKGNPTIDPEHMKHLEAILERIDPAYLEDLKVQLYESTYNTGRYTPSTNTVDLFYGNQATQLDSVTKAAIESTMSMAEVYAHELTHAGLEFAFSQNLIDRNLFAKEIRQLGYLHTEASAHVTWEDFMPKEGTYDPALKELHEKQAKITYDYIFKNTDKNNPLAGLAEFCAYGITNPRLMEKLKSISTTAKQQQKEHFIIRLLKTIKALFSAAFNKQKAGDLLPYLLGVTKGITSRHRNQNIYQELDRIVGRLHSADTKAANSILRHPVKAIELAFKAFDIVRRFGNRIISPIFNFIWYANDTFKIFKEADLRAAKIGETGLDIARKVSTSMLLAAISSTHRKFLKNMILACLQASHTSTFGSIINDMTATDEATDQLQLLGLRTRLIDAASKQREADMYSILSSSFEKTLSTLEEESLHDVVLRTDLQSLLDETTSVSDIISMLKNKDEVQARISGIESILAKESGYTKEQLTWVKNQSRFLARYMTTGIGCECLNLNARQIAKGVYCPTKLNTDGNEKIISLIDKLTSLYALNSTNDDMKTVVSTLSVNGLDTFLSAHKTFVKDSYEGIQVADSMNGADIQHPIEAQHVIKGYTKQLFDTSYEIRVEYADGIMEDILAKEGFVKQKTLPANKLTKSSTPMAIYRREYATPRRRDGASFITTSSNSIGTSLMDNAYNTAALESRTVTGYRLWKIYKDRGMKLNQHISKQMTKKLLTDEEMDRMSANYTPIYSPKTNNASDFRISMEHQTKKDVLGADTRGLTVLSKMYATQLTKIQANARNEAVLQFLINDYKENGPKTSSNLGKNLNPYVKLAKNSDNKFVRDAYNSMPTMVQEYIKKNELYVREDWLRMLFGTPTASITDIKTLNKITGIKGKRAIHIVEALLRFLASEVKRKIVNMPKVVIGNIMSNFTYSSIIQGRDPYKVFKMQIENARNIRLYTTLTHEYNQLELKRRMGKSEPNTEARMIQLARQIERNPVAPLVERGFYQSIVEDIRPEDMESTGSIHKYFKNTKLFNKIPNLLKTIGKNVYMTEGTPIYDFLFTITQYSDFVARATEYQLLMEKAPDKDDNPSAWKDYEQQATRTVLNTFINYDKPQSTVEQYLNDHGITWFTKFAKRIQPIINGQILHNPMGVLGMLLFQHTIFDAESIVEQNMFMKHWLYLGRNPYDNFIDALIPMSYTTFIK